MKKISVETKLKFKRFYTYLDAKVKLLPFKTKLGTSGFVILFFMLSAKYAPNILFKIVSVLVFLVSGYLISEVLKFRSILLVMFIQFMLSLILYMFDISKKFSDLMIILIFLEITVVLLFKFVKSK